MNFGQTLLSFAALFLMTHTSAALPRIASLNLCADSLLLELAAPSQIVSVSWLAQDAALSNYSELAKQFPSNHGHIEELIPYSPDLVFTGANTSAIDNALLARLGFEVIQIHPDGGFDDYEANLRLVGKAIERPERADILISRFHTEITKLPPHKHANGIIFQANGYSPGSDSLPGQMLAAAGLKNSNKENLKGRFLSIEELLKLRPGVIVLTSLNNENPSLADLYLSHPILRSDRFSEGTDIAWKPKTVIVEEKYFNCGSQFIGKAISRIRNATNRILK